MLKDSEKMLEMLNDVEINKNFSFAGKKFTINEVSTFIAGSNKDLQRIDYAIVDEQDNYLGTISLKNLNFNSKEAEYAISLTKNAIGKGAATIATNLLVEKAIVEFNLKEIYLNVKKDNFRAINFYKKYGFEIIESKGLKEDNLNLIWFALKFIN